MNQTFHAILLIVAVKGCEKQYPQITERNNGLYTYATYPIGAAIDIKTLNYDTSYRGIAIREFNSLTPENIFKAQYIHPQPNVFNWDEAYNLVNFCYTNNKRLHGHTLIWHQENPEWMNSFKGNASEWDNMMKIHIKTIVSHFKGQVTSWDVVNEAFNDDGSFRDNIWYNNIGESYIEKAFRYAYEADTNVLLFYNEYNLESSHKKRKRVIDYLNDLRRKGVKIDGIGLQMHVNIKSPGEIHLSEALKNFTDNGYRIHLSEIDISINPKNRKIRNMEKLLGNQAEMLGEIAILYKQIPPQYQYGITFWGISDKTSWIRLYYKRNDHPLLYDDNYKAKPCYWRFKECL